ncbi:cyclic dehypoxanthinyl futalosine synthase [Thermovibrio ammonificans]|jgi:cyclic dehypoxanthinyl futalosine synthase|uniref:Cyclic dehypoxanthine futalosine synthase n=1 Tax=Thermovibrio ammonificans (strain DSM 15698 / JCM 12110 / HB-1) TaxID=648996 RepID=E8T3J7_THEA1|nr:cyclic dehypoxanthinyl futalosine synthase [Thermovibrio ammonificans]ADU96128.1 Radical SAM domain protein [Thermovibrio ammonificans HB-1]
MNRLAEKVLSGERITAEEALELLNADLLTLGQLANFVRNRKHPEREVTFVIDRNINYTNVCVCRCRFCAFYRDKGAPDAYVIEREELRRKIVETIQLGGTAILLQGGLHPDLGIEFYEELLRFIKGEFPQIHVHGFSAPEIVHIARVSNLTVEEVIRRLKRAGLGSIPGGGAEILTDRVRQQIAPNKIKTKEWLEVHRTAHKLGLRTTATMMFGSLDTDEDIVEHLSVIRELQDETGGFTAFIPWSYQPDNTELGRQVKEKASGERYLKVLALSRIFLDNFDNVQASWVTQGGKMAQVALKFGANDFGSLMIEENVVAAAGVKFRLPLSEIIRLIKDAGYRPVQRDTLYRKLRYFD